MKHFLKIVFITLACATPFYGQAQIITTVAGDSTAGYNGDNIPAVTAELNLPIGIALDLSGNLLICDRHNNRIRKVSPAIGGVTTTIAGTGLAGFSGDDSAATAAKINFPYGIAVDASGNIYFSDVGNSRIRKINAAGVITTIAGTGTGGFGGDGGPATAAMMNAAGGLAVDGAGNIYIADYYNDRIRKIDPSDTISTIAGGGIGGIGDGGPATNALISAPEFVAVDGSGNIFITETGGNRVRKVNSAGIISTVAGTGISGYSGDGGPATTARLNSVYGIAIDEYENIYVCDAINDRIRKINSFGIITTIAGDGGSEYNGNGLQATVTSIAPVAITLDNQSNIYISDAHNNRIRYMSSDVFVSQITNSNIDINLYPNPNKGHFVIEASSMIDERTEFIIINSAGETIKTIQTVTNKAENVFLYATLGIYIIKVVNSIGVVSYQKMLIE